MIKTKLLTRLVYILLLSHRGNVSSAFHLRHLPTDFCTAKRFSSFSRNLATDSGLVGQPTELPDSLVDAATMAAEASAVFGRQFGPLARCRVDFDTSAGDETYSILKTSTEFMQHFVSSLCYAIIPGLQEQRQNELLQLSRTRSADSEDKSADEADKASRTKTQEWKGPLARIYFPDEGNAALARRDWLGAEPKVPPCVVFASCGSAEKIDVTNDELVFFFCPRASESSAVEEILLRSETAAKNLQMTVFVNPYLVDMGVTGFGMAGRLLRERLIDPLQCTYYLRTLRWGALTRKWPQAFSVWQEDANEESGYQLLQSLDRLPSNPEVEDIYDMASGGGSKGPIDQIGDFISGMMRL